MRPVQRMAGLASAVAIVGSLAAGCRLGPLVDDVPGASVNLLPAGTAVPSATDNAALASQIALNDGLDDRALAQAKGLIARGTGASAGSAVHYWSFGAATQVPSPLYQFVMETAAGRQPIDHPPLVDAVPGDPGYSALHTLAEVVVTAKYAGERITSSAALSDAIELGLVRDPEPTGAFVTSPIVLPGTTLEVGGDAPAQPILVYGHGYAVAMFQLGGDRGLQPDRVFEPTAQVSFLRAAVAESVDRSRPIFQAVIPSAPPTTQPNYTPLAVVIDVELAPDISPDTVLSDTDLFKRSATGAITTSKPIVARFEVTSSILLLPLQFAEGQP
jgi:hypothetical protein